MKYLPFTLLLLMCLAFTAIGQNIGFNDDNSNPKASAMVDVYSTTKGMLIPRVTLTSTTSASPVTSPETSLLVYNIATANDITPGYYYWDSTKWVRLETSSDPEINFACIMKSANATLLKTDNMVAADGDITLTLPSVTSADNGLEIVIKNVGTYTDLITVKPQSGKKIDASDSSMLTRWNGKTYMAHESDWIVVNKDSRVDNLLDVSATGSFATIAEVVGFLNDHMNGPTVVRIGGGVYPISSTQTINLPYPVTFQGVSYDETTIIGTAGVSGTPLFNCQTECMFKMLNFIAYSNAAGNDGIRLTGSGTYHEIKDSWFSGFNKGIVSTTNHSLVWVFETAFSDCTGAGIEIAEGANAGGFLRVSECMFVQCAKGIHLLSGVAGSLTVMNTNFSNTASGTDIGILYVPATYTSFTTIFLTNNLWNHQGTFISGFDFTRSDGRDANAYLKNNAGCTDENPHCKINISNSTASTALNNSSVWYRLAAFTGGTSNNYPTKWTIAGNRVTYQPVYVSDGIMFISGNLTCSFSGGGVKTINLAIVKNTATSPASDPPRYGKTTIRIAGSTQTTQFSTNVFLPGINQNDYFEIWINITSVAGNPSVIMDDLNWYTDTH